MRVPSSFWSTGFSMRPACGIRQSNALMRPIPLHCDRPARDGARLTGTALDVIDGVTAPVIIVGHSMGAQVAERAAVARPDAVAAIVLLTPVVLCCRRR